MASNSQTPRSEWEFTYASSLKWFLFIHSLIIINGYDNINSNTDYWIGILWSSQVLFFTDIETGIGEVSNHLTSIVYMAFWLQFCETCIYPYSPSFYCCFFVDARWLKGLWVGVVSKYLKFICNFVWIANGHTLIKGLKPWRNRMIAIKCLSLELMWSFQNFLTLIISL